MEQTFNRQVLPALAALGLVKDGLRLQISKSKDIEALWNKTVQALPYYEIDPEWIKETFGLDVTARKTAAQMRIGDSSLNLKGGTIEVKDFFA